MTTDRAHHGDGVLLSGTEPRLPDASPSPSFCSQRLDPSRWPPPLPRSIPVVSPDGFTRRDTVPDLTAAPDAGRSPASIEEAHRATRELIRSGRRGRRFRRPWWQRIVRALTLLVSLGIVATAAVYFVSGIRSKFERLELPNYGDIRPSYGTAVFDVNGIDVDGTEYTYSLSVNGSATHAEWNVHVEGEGLVVRRTPIGTFLRWEGVWAAIEGNVFISEMFDEAAEGLIFADFVPDAARPFARLRERDDVVIDGRRLTRLDIVFDDTRFEAMRPDAFGEWIFRDRAAEPTMNDHRVDGVHVEFWVDSAGVVWRWENRSDISEWFFESRLVRLDDVPFTTAAPVTICAVDAPAERRAKGAGHASCNPWGP